MKKIKKIVHISDIHFRTFKRHDEYKEILIEVINSIKEETSEYDFDEIRIVITGDIVHQKITISNELTVIVAWFLDECSKLAETIIIAGNHDLLANNKDRLDSLTPIIGLMKNENISYFKKSGCYIDENIIWAVYSVFDDNTQPQDITETKNKNKSKTVVGLFHGPVIGSKTALGYEFTDVGVHIDYFSGCDMVLLGDIHKRNFFEFDDNGKKIPMAFSGSLIQQDFGESITGHGYLIWDVETKTYDEIDVESDYGFYQYTIDSIDDINNENEKLTNI